jgi:hypothetical protein
MGSSEEVLGYATLGMSNVINPPDMPEPPAITEPPPPVEDVDVAGQEAYTKGKLKARKGRQSTILASMGSNKTGKKTILG